MSTRRDPLLDEVLGGVGYSTEIVGAVRNARRVGDTQIVGGGGHPHAIETTYEDISDLVAGIPITTIPAGATVAVDVALTRAFRPRRLVLSGFQAGAISAVAACDLLDLKIANISQKLNDSPIAAETFIVPATGIQLRGDTAQPGVGIQLFLRNNSGEEITIGGAFFGPAATPYGAYRQRGGNGAEVGGMHVQHRVPREVDELMLGVDPVDFPPAGPFRQHIPVQVYKPMRVRRLVCTGANDQFLIHDIKVSNVSLFVNNSPVPAIVFAPTATGVRLAGETAQQGVGLTLDVEYGPSPGESLQVFRAQFFGPAAI